MAVIFAFTEFTEAVKVHTASICRKLKEDHVGDSQSQTSHIHGVFCQMSNHHRYGSYATLSFAL